MPRFSNELYSSSIKDKIIILVSWDLGSFATLKRQKYYYGVVKIYERRGWCSGVETFRISSGMFRRILIRML